VPARPPRGRGARARESLARNAPATRLGRDEVLCGAVRGGTQMGSRRRLCRRLPEARSASLPRGRRLTTQALEGVSREGPKVPPAAGAKRRRQRERLKRVVRDALGVSSSRKARRAFRTTASHASRRGWGFRGVCRQSASNFYNRAAGALEWFTVDLLTIRYKRAAGPLGVFTAGVPSTVYQSLPSRHRFTTPLRHTA